MPGRRPEAARRGPHPRARRLRAGAERVGPRPGARRGAGRSPARRGAGARPGARPGPGTGRHADVMTVVDHTFQSMGSRVRLIVGAPRAPGLAEPAEMVAALEAEVLDYAARLSRFRPTAS